MRKVLFCTGGLLWAAFSSFQPLHAQEATYWTTNDQLAAADDSRYQVFRHLAGDAPALRQHLRTAPHEAAQDVRTSPVTLEVPMPDGSFETFRIVESPIMAPELAAKFPMIRTYAGLSNKAGVTGRFDVTEKGFHGMVFTGAGTVFIDPHPDHAGQYLTYYKQDFRQEMADMMPDWKCELDDSVLEDPFPPQLSSGKRNRDSGPQLRVYRLALACTGEYAQFHGGTVAGALSAMTTSMNRVNGLYIRELAIRMDLIANNNLLIFLNGGSDPYSNNNGGAMLSQNVSTINSTIGSGNYDIGHVFSTGGGGIAGLGVICTNSKAEGVTGSNVPMGDAFDVDFVAHEIGHQFAGFHSFNGTAGSCSFARTGSAAFEPGSGTTIMAYAGICGSQNIQGNSDDHFHADSHRRIINFVTNSNGSACATISNSGNTAPVVTVDSGQFFIPIETPFVLDGSATDADGDAVTYTWEEMDLGPAGPPTSPIGTAPIFRSFSPTVESFRVFPRMLNVVTGQLSLGELYPTYTRNLSFRLTARDNHPTSGGVGSADILFRATEDAGPFVVTAPANGNSVGSESMVRVTWDPANTNADPVNSQIVNILLSTDNGFTYPDTLMMNTDNDGEAWVKFPDIQSTTARVQVQAADNIFFNISPSNFTIADIALDPPTDFVALTDEQTEVTLTWTDIATNEDVYIIMKSVGGTAPYEVIDSVAANVTTYVDQNEVFVAGQSSTYRIFAKNSQTTSCFVEAGYFPVSVEDLSATWSTAVYPNPSEGLFRIDVRAPHNGALTVDVLDAYGRVVRSEVVQKNQEFWQHTMDIQGMANGIYTVQLRMDQQAVAVRQLVKF